SYILVSSRWRMRCAALAPRAARDNAAQARQKFFLKVVAPGRCVSRLGRRGSRPASAPGEDPPDALFFGSWVEWECGGGLAAAALAEDVARAADGADRVALLAADQRLAQAADVDVHRALV